MILEFLFKGDYHYELFHELALARLLEQDQFAFALLGLNDVRVVKLEPEKGTFDICVETNELSYYLEVKTGSQIGDQQVKKQKLFIESRSQKYGYVVLGSASLLYRESDIEKLSDGNAHRFSYQPVEVFA